MKQKNNISFWIIFILIGFFTACQDDFVDQLNFENNEEPLFLREISLLLGEAISNSQDRNELKNLMSEVDTYYGELVSFAFLLGDKDNYKTNELNYLKSSGGLSSGPEFLNKMKVIFENNEDKFPHLHKKAKKAKKYSPNLKSSDSREIFDYLTSLISGQYQIFYPYDPEFEDDDTSLPFYYTSYDPLNGANKNEVFYFNEGGSDFEILPEEYNDFLDDNPVFLVIPVDPCDLPGNDCDVYLLIPPEEDDLGFPPDYPGFPFEPGDDIGDLPPPANGGSVLLTYNVDHNNMTDDNDMITTRVAKIRVKGTSWMGFGSTHQKLRFMRGAGEGQITITGGQILAAGVQFTVGPELKISRKNVKKKRWVNANLPFDADWLMSKNTQNFAVFSIHHLVTSTAKVNASYKSGFKINAQGNIEAHQESSGSGTLDIQLNAARFRANTELSRRQVLITIVGDNSTYTYTENGVDYNVKEIGIVEFYFKHWHTSFNN